MDSVKSRVRRLLDAPHAGDLRETVDRLRSSSDYHNQHMTPWTGFCEAKLPPLRRLLEMARGSPNGQPGTSSELQQIKPQSLVLAEVNRINVETGCALTRLIAVWPPGAMPPADGTSPSVILSALAPRYALLHGSRAHPPHVAFLTHDEPPGGGGGGGKSVLLPSWLHVGARMLALVVSCSANGERIALSLNPLDCTQGAAHSVALAPLLGVTSLPVEAFLGAPEEVAGLPAGVEGCDGGNDGGCCATAAGAMRPSMGSGIAVRNGGAAGEDGHGGPSVSSSAPSSPPPAGAWELTFAERLACQPAFHHPRAAEDMRATLGLPHLLSCLPPPSAAVQRRVNGYIQMRNEQNTLWAAQSVKRGVTYAKAGQSAEAIASYNHAIELDRTHAGETQKPVYEWTMSARLCRSPPPPQHTHTPYAYPNSVPGSAIPFVTLPLRPDPRALIRCLRGTWRRPRQRWSLP